jgi:hypothetical protein
LASTLEPLASRIKANPAARKTTKTPALSQILNRQLFRDAATTPPEMRTTHETSAFSIG